MAGVFGAHVMQALKLLTPRELGRLTELLATSKKSKRVQKVAGGESSVVDTDLDHAHHQQEDLLRESLGKVVPLRQRDRAVEEVHEEETVKRVVGGDIVDVPVHGVHQVDEYDEYEDQEEGYEGEEGKVVQIRPPSREEVSPEYHARNKGESKLAGIGIYSKARIEAEEEELRRREHAKQPSTSVFILSEKEKIKDAHTKLKGQNARQVYRKQLSMDIENSDKEDLGKSTVVGVLLNKVK